MIIKKGDNVQIIAGKDKGKKGTVEQVVSSTGRLVVSGVHIRKHHLKPTRTRPKGGIVEAPAPFSRANAMLLCPHCSQPTRGKHLVAEDGRRYRACSKCSTSIDTK